ncbi:M23 family metallopeptidase [Paracoccus methylarcula]|nr:M23 family metallopeptidase [Paracoccus methylarcula]
MIGVDPRFRNMGKAARRRRRRIRVIRWVVAVSVMSVIGVLGFRHFKPDFGALLRLGDQGQTLVQVESEFDIAPVVRTDTFTDIPGDPLIIPSPDDGQSPDIREEPVPAALASARRVPAASTSIAVLESELLPRNRQLVAALPSSREEFALFQAERSRARLMNASLSDTEPAAAMVPADQRATSSIAFLRDADQRSSLWREIVVEATRPVPIDDLLARNGFGDANAAYLGERIRNQLSLDETLPKGSLMALRYRLRGDERQVIQVTLYGTEGFIGSLALSQAGQLVPSADAWADQSLLDQVMSREDEPGTAGQQRLLDLIYSAALRNDVPSQVTGEALAMMAKVHDLDSYADDSDRLSLIYAPGRGAGDPGSILFIGVSGPAGERACYVVPGEESGFECYAPGSRVQQRDGGAQMIPPVSGVLSQRFVPASGDETDRGYVIWSAPEGSTVVAAGDGRVTLASVDDRDGVQVEITHTDGMISRYGGLASLSGAVAQGGEITRGTPVGVIGGSIEGRQDTGLVFRLIKDGSPVDPMPYLSSAGQVRASDAIEALIGQIIQVESAGNARAQNPRSTATGLGQFIESTWLRMMRSYRPDLVSSLSRSELLNLRFDPDMSREMVRHLAQENEAYLRARGHSISAGRLYLAHFLGPAGADQALRADPSRSVGSVMGAGVVSANPFLRGYSIGDLRNWADRKMSGHSGTELAVTSPEPPLSPELRAYVSEIDRLRGHESG